MNIYTVDGNIGAGKSSVLEYIHKHYRIPIDLEPVEKWQPYLEDMYYRGKGAFEFQVRVWLDRCWIQSYTHTTPMLMERSPLFQRDVFVPVNLEKGRVTQREYESILEMYNRSMATWTPQAYIYIRSDPLKCAERVKQRGRNSEEGIPDIYLQRLHALHEDTYNSLAMNGCKVVAVDMENKTIPEVAAEVVDALKQVGWQGRLVPLSE
jgi:deoxyadenosine/deoxycytidine kinase